MARLVALCVSLAAVIPLVMGGVTAPREVATVRGCATAPTEEFLNIAAEMHLAEQNITKELKSPSTLAAAATLTVNTYCKHSQISIFIFTPLNRLMHLRTF
jgi:hypothetical protein